MEQINIVREKDKLPGTSSWACGESSETEQQGSVAGSCVWQMRQLGYEARRQQKQRGEEGARYGPRRERCALEMCGWLRWQCSSVTQNLKQKKKGCYLTTIRKEKRGGEREEERESLIMFPSCLIFPGCSHTSHHQAPWKQPSGLSAGWGMLTAACTH